MLKCAVFICMSVLFLTSIFIHNRLDRIKISHDSPKFYMSIPSGDLLKPFTLGYDQLVADFFWIQAISYFGDHLKSDRRYPWLYHILDLVTTLDPDFIWPYYFGGIVLSLEANQVEQSNRILQKASKYHPTVWKFPLYLGFNYWYHNSDPLKAASYIEIAAKLPGSPRYLKTLPASLYSESGQKEAALRFLQEMEENTQDPHMKAAILKRIMDIRKGKMRPVKKPRKRE